MLLFAQCSEPQASIQDRESEAQFIKELPVEEPSERNVALPADTLHGKILPRQGFVPLLRMLGLTNTQALSIGNNLKDHIDMTEVALNDPFYVVMSQKPENADSNYTPRVLEFHYIQNKIFHHKMVKKDNNWSYHISKEPTKKVFQTMGLELQQGEGFWQLLKRSGIPHREVHRLSHALVRGAGIHRGAKAGDSLYLFTEYEIYEQDTVEFHVIHAEFSGAKNQGEFYRYLPADPKSVADGYYTPEGKSLLKGKWLWPVDQLRISCEYGWRRHPITGRRSFHTGLDLLGDVGEPIRAISGGVVKKSTYGANAGNYIEIKHSNGYSSTYMHLDESLVQAGQVVKAGEVIGKMGNTGRSTNPHLHLEMRTPGGSRMDPYKQNFYAGSTLNEKHQDRFVMQIRNNQRARLETSKGLKLDL